MEAEDWGVEEEEEADLGAEMGEGVEEETEAEALHPDNRYSSRQECHGKAVYTLETWQLQHSMHQRASQYP